MAYKTTLTWTELSTFQTCEKKWWFEYHNRLTSKGDTPDYLTKGSIWHEVMAVYYDNDCSYESASNYAQGAIAGWRANEVEAHSEDSSQVEVVDLWWAQMGAMLLFYDWKYRDEDKSLKVLMVEEVFRVPIVNPVTGRMTPLRDYCGMLDLLVERPDGVVGLMDHKTSSRGQVYFDVDLYRQIYGYRMGATKKPAFVLYNVIRKPGLKIKKDESLPDYRDRLCEDMKSRPEFYVNREGGYANAGIVEAWGLELWQWHQKIRAVELSGIALPNTTACRSNFGVCPFRSICVDPSHEVELMELFDTREHRHPELTDMVPDEAR